MCKNNSTEYFNIQEVSLLAYVYWNIYDESGAVIHKR